MTVGELLRRCSSRELSEWRLFYDLEPFGEWRADLRAGIVASTIANVNRDPKKQRKAFSHEDFMPKFEQKESGKQAGPKKQTWQEQLAIVEAWNKILKGKDLRGTPSPLTPFPLGRGGEGM